MKSDESCNKHWVFATPLPYGYSKQKLFQVRITGNENHLYQYLLTIPKHWKQVHTYCSHLLGSSKKHWNTYIIVFSHHLTSQPSSSKGPMLRSLSIFSSKAAPVLNVDKPTAALEILALDRRSGENLLGKRKLQGARPTSKVQNQGCFAMALSGSTGAGESPGAWSQSNKS